MQSITSVTYTLRNTDYMVTQASKEDFLAAIKTLRDKEDGNWAYIDRLREKFLLSFR